MTLIRFTQPNSKGVVPDRRSYDEVLDLRDESGNLIRSSSSPRGSTYHKRLQRCAREHALYHGGLRRDFSLSEHLTVGLMVHRALEHFYGGRIVGAIGDHYRSLDDNDERRAWNSVINFATEEGYEETWKLVERMLNGYFERYRTSDRNWKVWAVEETVSYYDAGFEWTGRYDGLIEKEGALWLLENKTAKAITEDLLSGYQMDMQMLGYVWLFKKVIDVHRLPPFAGIIVNLLTKHVTPRYERVEVCPSRYHLAEFEDSMRRRIQLRGKLEELGWPKILGNCSGSARYFSRCDYFDICHGAPDVSLARLLREEPPMGYVKIDLDQLDPDEAA